MSVNENTYTFDDEGKIKTLTTYSKESKFIDKNVAIMTEVEAFKVTTSPDASGSMLPQVSFGWFWTLFIDVVVAADNEIFFCKTNSHWFVGNTSGMTMFYMKNNSNKDQRVKIKSIPKMFIDTPLMKFGNSTNKTDVDISPGGDPDDFVIKSNATDGNTLSIKLPNDKPSIDLLNIGKALNNALK